MTRDGLFEDLVPVILAGGSGTRLWPVSRALYPKHLVALLGKHSLMQDTVLRLNTMAAPERLVVVGAESQGKMIARQLLEIVPDLGDRLILEPAARNTAAAVALAAHQAMSSFGEKAVIFVCPSDHLILAPEFLKSAVGQGLVAARQGKLVTFGIKPSHPETGFGYIKQGRELADASGVLAVDKFVEKPELAVAETMLADGRHVWNSGMFLMRADIVLAELAKFEPELAAGVQSAFNTRQCIDRPNCKE